jgi:cyclopropane fatty-acyl-phospholipid synthase-like methyltransferase
MSVKETLPSEYFEAIYAENDDPWNFASSPYESAKYAATLAALPRERYGTALEIGCSIGVLTEKLAARCEQILSVDVSRRALEQAAQRCQNLSNVRFAVSRFPFDAPTCKFDLIVVSEVGYYLSESDWQTATEQIIELLEPNGDVVLVHWTEFVADYPQTGDAVHEQFEKLSVGKLNLITNLRETQYRLSVYRKSQPRKIK